MGEDEGVRISSGFYLYNSKMVVLLGKWIGLDLDLVEIVIIIVIKITL